MLYILYNIEECNKIMYANRYKNPSPSSATTKATTLLVFTLTTNKHTSTNGTAEAIRPLSTYIFNTYWHFTFRYFKLP